MKRLIGVTLVVFVVLGCAVKPSPELVAARAVTVLELVQTAQRSLIAAEAAGLIDRASTVTALTRINEGVRHAQALGPLLEGWEQLSVETQQSRLDQARVVVFTLSQVLAAVLLPGGQMAPIQEALLGANELLLRISDLRGDL